MASETDLFFQSPLEKNVILKQKLGARRRKRFGLSDVTDITLHRWPHADDYLTKLQPYVRFIYTPWFTFLTLACFAVMFWMWIGKFDEIWYDSFRFYNFAEKSSRDLVEFWFLFGAMAFFHESAHGMTCKHFGGNVEKMEFLLMYFAPTFVCDVTQIWVIGERKARLCTVIAGIWVDLIICFFATVVWWMTAPGMWTHDFAYKVIMVSGIGVTLINLNPLIKLDGYYMFSELMGEADLKERSTLYVSEWTKKHLFQLPVEVEYVPTSRRALYIGYAVLSGLYSYSLMLVVVLFCFHVARAFTPEFAWVGALIIGYLIFQSRLRKLVRFMKDVYLDKKDRLHAWFTLRRVVVFGGLALIVLFLPVWPDFVEARFVLEPASVTVVRAEVDGEVQRVDVSEDEVVQPGKPLVELQNLRLESEAGQSNARYTQALAHATDAEFKYAGQASAESERQEAMTQKKASDTRIARLQLSSPVQGVVSTPHVEDLVGHYVTAGTPLLEIINDGSLRARVFIPEYSVRDVRPGARTRLQLASRFLPISASLSSLAPVSAELDPALLDKEQLSGIVPPPYYVGFVDLPNDGGMRAGMSGTAKIYVRRQSFASMGARFAGDLLSRRFW